MILFHRIHFSAPSASPLEIPISSQINLHAGEPDYPILGTSRAAEWNGQAAQVRSDTLFLGRPPSGFRHFAPTVGRDLQEAQLSDARDMALDEPLPFRIGKLV